jgi:hypothetical protein
MAYRVGWVPAVAILVSIGSTPATATTQVYCNQVQTTGPEVSHCFDSHPDEYTDPSMGLQGVAGIGEATADLRTGALKSRSVGQAYQDGPYDLYASGGSIAQIVDKLTFGGGFSGTIQIRMDVSGSFAMSDPLFGSGGPQMAAYLDVFNSTSDLGTANVFATQYTSGFGVHANPSASGGASASTNASPVTGDFVDPADVRALLTVNFAVGPSNPTVTIFARLATGAAVNRFQDTGGEIKTSELNFGNSAYLSLIVPEGVPWTSESGAFLTAVPEPGTGALLAAGMLCLSSVRRARQPSARASTRSRRASPRSR